MRPMSVSELQAMARECPKLQPAGAGSKPALRRLPAGAVSLDLTGLRGMLEYQPEEYTFTALAGTPLLEVEAALAEHGQYLPFDPVLGEHGATLGGTVAAGLSGPGRYRYGGVRDFLLAVQFVDGLGRAIRSGGKVVKNSAGFDLSKLMVGSLGAYGALTEITIKVLPRPQAWVTVQAGFPTLGEALDALVRLSGAPLDLFALDIAPYAGGALLQARLCGEPGLFSQRIDRVRSIVGRGEALSGPEESQLWHAVREFHWVNPGGTLVKIPATPGTLLALDAWLSSGQALRRYSVGANLAWVSWAGSMEALDGLLAGLNLHGLVLWGESGLVHLGKGAGGSFERRIKAALDPRALWVEVA